MAGAAQNGRFMFWSARLDPMTVVSLLVIPALLLELYAPDVKLQRLGLALNWLTWFGFCAEFLFLLALAPSRAHYTRAAWFDLSLVVLSVPVWASAGLQSTRGLCG